MIDADLNISAINNYTSLPCPSPFNNGCLVPLNITSDGVTNVTLQNLRLNGFIFITVFDENTNANISSGITVRILNTSTGATLFTNTTDTSGSVIFSNVSFGSNRANAGTTGSIYPTIRTINFDHTAPNTSITMRLVNVNDGVVGIVQVVDNQFLSIIEGALVRTFKNGILVNEEFTDSNGITADSFLPNNLYFFNVSANGFVTQTSLLTFVLEPFVFRLATITPSRVNEDKVFITTFPLGDDVLRRDGSVCFGMSIFPDGFSLSEFGVMYGIDSVSLLDDTIPPDILSFKFEVANSSNLASASNGGTIDCNSGVGNALNLSIIQGNVLYVRYYYSLVGDIGRRDLLRTFSFTNSVQGGEPGATDFFGGLREVLSDLGFEELGLALIAFLIIFRIITDLAAREVGYRTLGTITWFLVALFTLVNWLPFYVFFFSTIITIVLGVRVLRSFE